ncbi:Group II intron-encoded protein LtrA [Thermoflexales bacterium]|nr:Group II intron-encoded protein LtrA [Thermoflexales bacterium]
MTTHFLTVGLFAGKEVVAIYTTAKESSQSTSRKTSLDLWLKRTQEVLAYTGLQGQKFDSLYNLMRTKRLVEVALDHVLRNEGAKTAGIDGVTKVDLATDQDRARLIDEIHAELCAKTYKPRPVRRTYIPKPGKAEKRPLGIPIIKDRVVQEMLKLIMEPIYEGKFYQHSYGFRPMRSTLHAALRCKDLIGRRGYTHAIEGDIRKCFDRIHHNCLLKILRKTIRDERIIRLIRSMLKAGVMEDGAWQVTDEGTPQGGIVSPLLANIYLNELDWFIAAKWEMVSRAERLRRKSHGVALPCFIVRYADDFVILIQGTREQADLLKTEVGTFLATELHLELSVEKTLVTDVEQGIDFLGFHIRKYRQVTLITPSRKAMSRFRENVKRVVQEGFCYDDVAAVEHLNRYLIGWGMYYRRVSSARAFRQADHYVWKRVWTTSRRKRNRKLTRAQHYKVHRVPYRYDIRIDNRKRKGGHYGAWADEAKTKAYIVIRLAFIPIRYEMLYPRLNPYVPQEREILEKRGQPRALPPDQETLTAKEYGLEWRTLRRHLLAQAEYRCQQCGKPVRGRQAHVHHKVKLVQFKSRRQANLLENLIVLCPSCHKQIELRA